MQGAPAKVIDIDKLHKDALETMATAVQAESRLRRKMILKAIVFDLGARRAAKECVEALDLFDELTAKAKTLGVSL